jgi:hypothetical protein
LITLRSTRFDNISKWLFYEGTFFKSPLGTPFVGNLDLPSTQSERPGLKGTLRFENLHLLPTFKP